MPTIYKSKIHLRLRFILVKLSDTIILTIFLAGKIVAGSQGIGGRKEGGGQGLIDPGHETYRVALEG
jgi:hypothetical protein